MYEISDPTMEEIGSTNPKYVPTVVTFMVPICVPCMLEKLYSYGAVFSWHPFTHLLNKW